MASHLVRWVIVGKNLNDLILVCFKIPHRPLMQPTLHDSLWNKGVPFQACTYTHKSLCMWYFHGGESCVRVILTKYLRDQSPSIGVDIAQEETPPSLSVSQRKYCQSFQYSTMLWNLEVKDLYSSYPTLMVLTSKASPSASTPPTRPAWGPPSQRSTLLNISPLISLALWAPTILVRITWGKKRNISEFQLLMSTSHH